MPSRTWNRAAAGVLTAALALAVPMATQAGEREATGRHRRQAAGQRLSASGPVSPSPVSLGWSLLVAWWAKDGVLIDPNGGRVFDAEAASRIFSQVTADRPAGDGSASTSTGGN